MHECMYVYAIFKMYQRMSRNFPAFWNFPRMPNLRNFAFISLVPKLRELCWLLRCKLKEFGCKFLFARKRKRWGMKKEAVGGN